MNSKSTLERALELARTGSCQSITDIRVQLKREQHEAVDEHLSGFSIKQQIKKVLVDRQATVKASQS